MNLVLVTGLACGLIGGLIMFGSHSAIYRTASHIVAGYPRVLAALHAKRHDGRFGLCILACGIVLQGVAAGGYAIPVSLWRYPVSAIASILAVYGAWRLLTSRRMIAAHAPVSPAKAPARGLYDTRRSVRLRDAAQIEGAKLAAIERRREPRDAGVIFLAREWEQRWWSAKLGVSTEALIAAVRYAGPMVEDVRRYLASDDRAALAA